MKAYLLRRLLLIVPTFLGITVMVFAVTRLVPGGPVERIIAQAQQASRGEGGAGRSLPGDRTQPLSDEQIEELKRYYGLDQPLLKSYGNWLSRVLQGDLGVSTRYHDPVWEMIRERIPVSLYFGALTLLLAYGICIPLGVAKALHHRSGFDNLSSVVVFIGYAIPGWVIGVILLVLLASRWELFPLGGLAGENFADLSPAERLLDLAWHTALPLAAYLAGSLSVMTFLMKNTLMDNLAADYVRTAVAKGRSFRGAVLAHALRNSLIPIATHFGNHISILLSGSFLVEKVFNIDGMGLLAYESILERDYPVVLGILAISSLLLLVGNILSDICVALVDPRVTFR
jgi:microcin C transport system permease protein